MKRRVPGGGEKPTRMHGDPLQGGGVTLHCDVFILPGVRALGRKTAVSLTTATAVRRGRTPRSARRPPASPPTRRSPRLRRRAVHPGRPAPPEVPLARPVPLPPLPVRPHGQPVAARV